MPTPLSVFDNSSVILPQRVAFEGSSREGDICIRFLRHLSAVPNNRLEIKVLSAIQFVADMMDCSDAHIAKTLVDVGLRAPRGAFPASYLAHADGSLACDGWDIGAPNQGLSALARHWQSLGQDTGHARSNAYNNGPREEAAI